MLSIRHSNTSEGGHRNVFIEDGLVVLVTKYHKGYALSGEFKVIHRYLPRELGALVVLYFVVGQAVRAAIAGRHRWPIQRKVGGRPECGIEGSAVVLSGRQRAGLDVRANATGVGMGDN
jgi:hypothetical protein